MLVLFVFAASVVSTDFFFTFVLAVLSLAGSFLPEFFRLLPLKVDMTCFGRKPPMAGADISSDETCISGVGSRLNSVSELGSGGSGDTDSGANFSPTVVSSFCT